VFQNSNDLLNYISLNSHAETRSCEFKSGVKWENEFRYTIVKGILALSNLAGGGYIIIGVEWNDSTKNYEPVGMDSSISETYEHDVVLEFANLRADPFVEIELKHFEVSGKWIVVIQVAEFFETPVICKKSCENILEEGRMYYRTRKKPESSANLTYVDVREIQDYAITKGLGKLLQRLEASGLNLGAIRIDETDEEQFDRESEDFG